MLEREKELTEKFAKDNGLPISMVNNEAEAIYADLTNKDLQKPEEDRLSDNARMIRAYRRVRYAFKKKAKSLQNSVEGMIVCRYPDNDFNKSQYRIAKMKARKNKDEAIQQGFINEQGQPLYRFGDKVGQPITKADLKPVGKAAAYLMVENETGEKVPEPRFVMISKRNSEDNIPVCQVGKLSVTEPSKNQKVEEKFRFSNKNTMWYNAGGVDSGRKAPYTESELTNILTQWSLAFDSDKFVVPKVKDSMELEQFKNDFMSVDRKDEHIYDFCFAPMQVDLIKIPEGDEIEYANVVVVLSFSDMYSEAISIFVTPEHLQGLKIEENSHGIAVLQISDYSKGEPNPQWHLGGFLQVDDEVDIDKFFAD